MTNALMKMPDPCLGGAERRLIAQMTVQAWTRRGRDFAMVAALVIALWWPGALRPAMADSASPSVTSSGTSGATPQAAATASPAVQSHGELGAIIEAGTLPGLRWPNFTDHRDQVRKFYDAGGYGLAWSTNGQPTAQAKAMIEAFKQAQFKGLNPDDYDASRWDARMAKIAPATASPTESDLARFDLALTVLAMRYISDLHVGRVNPQHFKFALDVGARHMDLADFLRSQVLPAQNVDAVIQTVERPHGGYRRAEATLARYLKLAAEGDGEPVPTPPQTVRPGNTFAGMPELIRRLRQLGDLSADLPANATIYQGPIVDAVKHFQARHGLEPDGLLGKATVSEINKPLSLRVRQVALTLERYRWLPPNFPQPPILVNIPEFRLRTLRRKPGGYLTMNVVVGKAYRSETPVFTNQMRYVIFRPYWNVPASIQHAELIPKIQRNRAYLAKNGYEVVDRSDDVITDGSVSDEVLSGLRSGAYSIRQKPGPKNALGLVKFIFPNSYNVYLHSTPSVRLFSRARRDFSHGCIRVQNPVALAAWVLRDKPGWTLDKIRAVMDGDETVQVNLEKPIPVLILYSTAVVDPDGTVRFFNDIYGYDAKLEKALAAAYPYNN
jgi:murein L,D-transpeptidase YcbB/YkuD